MGCSFRWLATLALCATASSCSSSTDRPASGANDTGTADLGLHDVGVRDAAVRDTGSRDTGGADSRDPSDGDALLDFGPLVCTDAGSAADASTVALPPPVGYWPFDGTANDASGRNIDLKLVGDASYAPSLAAGLGSALSLDGDGDGAIGANFVKVGGYDLTVVAWAFATDVDGDWDTLVKQWGDTKTGQFHLGLGTWSDNTLENHSGSETNKVVAPSDFPVGQWVHTAVVLDACAWEHRLYVDGVLVATGSYAGSLADGGATGLGVGVKPTDNGLGVTGSAAVAGYWSGSIDEVAVYDLPLSTAQIEELHTRGLAGTPLYPP